jgi:hypothetical protein
MLTLYGTEVPLLMLDSPSPSQTEMSFATGGTKKWTWYIPGGGSNFSLWHAASPVQNYLTFNGTTGDVYLAQTSGRVGIGTTSPAATLDVVGAADVTGSDESRWVLSGHNTHTTGTGVAGIANSVTGSVIAGGSGVAGTGFRFGVYGRATQTGNHNQAGGYFSNGAGDYVYVACHTSGGVSRKIEGSGSVNTVMQTSKGRVSLVCPESPEAWIEDYGTGEIAAGAAHVDLDPTFLECTTVDEANPLKVFVELTSPLEQQYYVKKGDKGFDVIVVGEGAAAAGCTFDYKVVARWKGYENSRFEKGLEPMETVELSGAGSRRDGE